MRKSRLSQEHYTVVLETPIEKERVYHVLQKVSYVCVQIGVAIHSPFKESPPSIHDIEQHTKSTTKYESVTCRHNSLFVPLSPILNIGLLIEFAIVCVLLCMCESEEKMDIWPMKSHCGICQFDNSQTHLTVKFTIAIELKNMLSDIFMK